MDISIDYASDFFLDATSKTAAPQAIVDDSFEYQISNAFPNDYAEYTLEFDVPNAIEADGGCFVKYTFPVEIDISEVDQADM